jgi:hypothetical protein
MNGYNFTDRVRKVLQFAREEAVRLRHEYVGTEHILLAIIREGEGVAAAVLTNINVDLEEIQQHVEETVKVGKAENQIGPDLPYTSRAKKVIELAMSEARKLNHSYVGTEHLLLGLLGEAKGIAAQVLNDAGMNLETTRSETIRLLGGEVSPESRRSLLYTADQIFKTSIALIELHRVRFGTYPDSLDDLEFIGSQDRTALTSVTYRKVPDGYELYLPPVENRPDLSYPSEFWRGLGIRRSNVLRSDPTSQ